MVEVRVEPILELKPTTQELWNALASRVPSPNPFWEPAAAYAAARTLAEGRDVQLLNVIDDGRMVFAAPVIRGTRFRRIRVSHLATWTHTQCCAGNPLMDPHASPDVWPAILRQVRAEGASWLVLAEVDVHTEAMHRLREAMRARHSRTRTLDVYERPVVLKRTGQPITIGLSSRHRSDLRRQRRGLDRQLGGESVARDLVAEESLEEAIATFLAVEASGWKGRAGTALASRPAEEEFFRQLCLGLHHEGRLQIWCLGTKSRPVALACNVFTGETVVRFKLCYDEEFRRFSPGVQLELEMLAAFEEDDERRWLDSCAAEANVVYQRIYSDSHTTGTIIAPTGGLGARALAAATPVAAKAFQRVKTALRGRRAD